MRELSDIEKKKVLAWFEKLKPINCPVCRGSKFLSSYELIDLTSLKPGIESFVTKGQAQAIPTVILRCNTCGHMMLFDSSVILE